MIPSNFNAIGLSIYTSIFSIKVNLRFGSLIVSHQNHSNGWMEYVEAIVNFPISEKATWLL